MNISEYIYSYCDTTKQSEDDNIYAPLSSGELLAAIYA